MLAAPASSRGEPHRVGGVQGDDVDRTGVVGLPGSVGDPPRARGEGDGVAEGDEGGRRGAADAAGTEHEVVGHGGLLWG